jgi:carboxypeptidase family protein
VRALVSTVVVSCIVMAGCGGDPPPTQPTPAPAPGPSPVTLVSIRTTPAEVRFDQLGQTVPLSVMALFSDGSGRDVTTEATWEISKPGIASIEGSVLIGRALGSTSFGAHYQGKGSWGWLTVEVPGDLRVPVSGVVRDQYGRPVASARIESSIMVFGATTDANGAFELERWYGPLPLTISKYGYETTAAALTIGGAPATLALTLSESPSPYEERAFEADSAAGSQWQPHRIEVRAGGPLDAYVESLSCSNTRAVAGVLTVRVRSGGIAFPDGVGCAVRVREIMPANDAQLEVTASSPVRYRVTYRVPR